MIPKKCFTAQDVEHLINRIERAEKAIDILSQESYRCSSKLDTIFELLLVILSSTQLKMCALKTSSPQVRQRITEILKTKVDDL